MAARLLAREVSDLCLGKPPLRSLPVSATVADALSALKRTGENYLSVWSCSHSSSRKQLHNVASEPCTCIGKVCMVDIVCYISEEDNLRSLSTAFQSPISVLLPKIDGLVRHLEPHSSVLEAIDLMLGGAQNLIVPLQSRYSRRKLLSKPSFSSTHHNGGEYCWLTQEDVLRFLLNSIGSFSPIAACTIDTLNIIVTNDILALHYHNPASSALPLISQAYSTLTSVAIIDEDHKLIGEISPFTVACCDETVAAAIATLSTGDLMAYIDCGGPPEELIKLVKSKLKEKDLDAVLELMDVEYSQTLSSCSSLSSMSSSSSSSDEESGNGKSGRIGGYSARMGRRSEAIVCYPWSSLVAVLMQALAHRVNYVWVVEEDGCLVGIVTFISILKVFRENCKTLS